MPCGDITDKLTIMLGPDDELVNYRLEKRTCGAPVGGYGALVEFLGGKPAEEILATPYHEFSATLTEQTPTLDFIFWKHYRAILTALAVYLGQAGGSAEDECTLVEMAVQTEGTEVVFDIKHDLPADKVKPCGTGCGNCNGACGASRRAERRAKREQVA